MTIISYKLENNNIRDLKFSCVIYERVKNFDHFSVIKNHF